MQFKFIDTKMKEIYYNSVPLKEDNELVESRYNFWNSMNIIGIQNLSVHQVKIS